MRLAEWISPGDIIQLVAEIIVVWGTTYLGGRHVMNAQAVVGIYSAAIAYPFGVITGRSVAKERVKAAHLEGRQQERDAIAEIGLMNGT